jgi:hypothetical protein
MLFFGLESSSLAIHNYIINGIKTRFLEKITALEIFSSMIVHI